MAVVLDNNCEDILLTLDPQKSVPAPFLTKTYQLVNDPATDHIVSWGEDNSTFIVWRPPELARDLLPNYFKHSNFSSFVRQLNTYGFRKIVSDRWEFANELFKKGEENLLCEIHRRKTSPPQPQPQSHQVFAINGGPAGRVTISSSDSDERELSPVLCNGSLSALSEDNERLRLSNSMLLSELSHMRRLYNDVVYFLQNHVKASTVVPSTDDQSNNKCLFSSSSVLFGNSSSVYNKAQNDHLHFLNQYVKEQKQQQQPNMNDSRTKLFGVPLDAHQSRKRLNNTEHTSIETKKVRLVMSKEDLGLKLMPLAPF